VVGWKVSRVESGWKCVCGLGLFTLRDQGAVAGFGVLSELGQNRLCFGDLGKSLASCSLCLLVSCYPSISRLNESRRGQLAPCSIIIMGVFDHLSTG
jgi:hypothetical protein